MYIIISFDILNCCIRIFLFILIFEIIIGCSTLGQTKCRGKCYEVGHNSSNLDLSVLENYPCEHIYFALEL